MKAAELVSVARELAGRPERRLGEARLTAACLLLRQALEEALDGIWAATVPALAGCPARAQLVSLPYYLPDEAQARDVSFAWYRLSSACHHDSYDLQLDASEIARVADIVGRLAERTQEAPSS